MNLSGLAVECQELKEKLFPLQDVNERKETIIEYLKHITAQDTFTFTEFDKDFEWINTQEPLTVESLKGKVVVIDFFTYCCINCIHILPDLKALEDIFSVEDGLVVLGVHSAKFDNEKIVDNVINSVLRHNIAHPVVNDSQAKLWNYYEVSCWPTLLVLSPFLKPLFIFMGEGHRDALIEYITVALNYFKNENAIENHTLPITGHKPLSENFLLFPGKVCLAPNDENLVIADTGHHRLVVITKEGLLIKVIGHGTSGLKDGSFSEAQFSAPQGIACKDHLIFVADTENHAIRQIDIKKENVTTIAGTGQLGSDFVGGQIGIDQAINSPWDICLGSSKGSTELDLLFIAMAGSHQIWLLFLKDGYWLKNCFYKAGTCLRFAGSGDEENRNNSYPHKAAFAQPSGITLGQDCLYVADSESSSIRCVSLLDGSVKAVVGASKDPRNLFCYGDVDGVGVEGKLQHPLAIAWSKQKHILYVADSYNNKIKTVNPEEKTITSFCGSKTSGNVSGNFSTCLFNEPGGLCLSQDEKFLYVADTNNHVIKVLNLEESVVKELTIFKVSSTLSAENIFSKSSQVKRIKPHLTINLTPIIVVPDGTLQIIFNLKLQTDIHLTIGAPHNWSLFLIGADDFLGITGMKGVIDNLEKQPKIKLKVLPIKIGQKAKLEADVVLYACDDEGKCYMRTLLFIAELTVTESGPQDSQVSFHTVINKD